MYPSSIELYDRLYRNLARTARQSWSAVPPYSQCNNSPQNQKKNRHVESIWREQNQKKNKTQTQNKRKLTPPTLTNQYLELRKKKQKVQIYKKVTEPVWGKPGSSLTPSWCGGSQLWDTYCAAFQRGHLALITPYGIIKFQFQNNAWNSSDWHILDTF